MKNILSKLIRYQRRIQQLKERSWYKTLSGTYRDSHGYKVLSRKDIYYMTDKEFTAVTKIN